MKKLLCVILTLSVLLSSGLIVAYAQDSEESSPEFNFSEIEHTDKDITARYYFYYELKNSVLYELIGTNYHGYKTEDLFQTVEVIAIAFFGDEASVFNLESEIHFKKIDRTYPVDLIELRQEKSPIIFKDAQKNEYDIAPKLQYKNVVQINIPEKIHTIKYLYNFPNLEKVVLGKDVGEFGQSFSNCPKLTLEVDKENKYYKIQDTRLLTKDGKVQSYEFNPTSTYKIKKGVDAVRLRFNNPKIVKKVIVPYPLKELNNYGNQINTIQFYKKANVTKYLVIGNKYLKNVTYAKNQKFTGVLEGSKIEKLTLPASITTINDLYSCKKLSRVYINNKKQAPKLKGSSRDTKVFGSTKKGIKFYCKRKKVAAGLKKNLKNSGVRKAKIYVISTKLEYSNVK